MYTVAAVPGDDSLLQATVGLMEVTVDLCLDFRLASTPQERVGELDDGSSSSGQRTAVAAVHHAIKDFPPAVLNAKAVVTRILKANPLQGPRDSCSKGELALMPVAKTPHKSLSES